MFYKLDKDELEMLENVSKMTYTDYEIVNDLIPAENLLAAIYDLVIEVDRLKEQIEDMEQDIENNYEAKRYDPYTEYGVSEKDFVEIL